MLLAAHEVAVQEQDMHNAAPAAITVGHRLERQE
jgi:hypothetical protein